MHSQSTKQRLKNSEMYCYFETWLHWVQWMLKVGISARELRSQSAQVRFSIPNASSAEIMEKNIFFEINQVEEDSRNGWILRPGKHVLRPSPSYLSPRHSLRGTMEGQRAQSFTLGRSVNTSSTERDVFSPSDNGGDVRDGWCTENRS